jgi:hypothetical protein
MPSSSNIQRRGVAELSPKESALWACLQVINAPPELEFLRSATIPRVGPLHQYQLGRPLSVDFALPLFWFSKQAVTESRTGPTPQDQRVQN